MSAPDAIWVLDAHGRSGIWRLGDTGLGDIPYVPRKLLEDVQKMLDTARLAVDACEETIVELYDDNTALKVEVERLNKILHGYDHPMKAP